MDKARVSAALKSLSEGFPKHRGRKGKQGGSMPRSAGGGADRFLSGKEAYKKVLSGEIPQPVLFRKKDILDPGLGLEYDRGRWSASCGRCGNVVPEEDLEHKNKQIQCAQCAGS